MEVGLSVLLAWIFFLPPTWHRWKENASHLRFQCFVFFFMRKPGVHFWCKLQMFSVCTILFIFTTLPSQYTPPHHIVCTWLHGVWHPFCKFITAHFSTREHDSNFSVVCYDDQLCLTLYQWKRCCMKNVSQIHDAKLGSNLIFFIFCQLVSGFFFSAGPSSGESGQNWNSLPLIPIRLVFHIHPILRHN